MNHREKLAYLAGIIDGEGSIMLWKSKGSPSLRGQFNLRVNITSTDKILIDWLYENFGGHCYECNAPSRKANPHWKKQFTWTVPRPKLLNFLKEIHQFLVIKKERCEVAIKFRETFIGTGRYLTQEKFNLRCKLFEQMKHLNTHGS